MCPLLPTKVYSRLSGLERTAQVGAPRQGSVTEGRKHVADGAISEVGSTLIGEGGGKRGTEAHGERRQTQVRMRGCGREVKSKYGQDDASYVSTP